MTFKILQGDSTLASECQKLEELKIDGIIPGPVESQSCAVTFTINPNGMLDMRAVDARTGQSGSLICDSLANLDTKQMDAIH